MTDKYEDRNVREIVVAYLKDNQYDGLIQHPGYCTCKIDDLGKWCGDGIVLVCRPGVLVDGKIVEKEGK